MPFVPWVVLWVVIANFPRMDAICIWTVMTTTGITLIINCVQLEHQRLSIVGRVEKGRSKRTPNIPLEQTAGIPKPPNERNSFTNYWLGVWNMFQGYVGFF